MVRRLFDGLLRRLLARAFEQRHRTVHARFSGGRLASVVLALGIWVNATVASAEAALPVRTVDSVDLQRYAGDWYETARFPNRFQRRCAGDVRARYVLRSDGLLDVLNQCRTLDGTIDARGVARVVDPGTSAKLKVRFAPAALSFLPFVWGDYWILGLAADYSWAVVGSPDRNYLWILSRTPQLPAPLFAEAVAVARANGFDTNRLSATDSHRAD